MVPESPLRCLWIAPNGEAFARAIVPTQPASIEEEIPIGFFSASGESPLTDFSKRQIRVGGIELAVQQGGIARIPLSRLLEVEEPWRLEVGPSWEEWPLKSAE
jgi:hypothetical protein